MNINYTKISELPNCDNVENTVIPVSEMLRGNNYETKKISYSNLSSNIYSNVRNEFINLNIDKVNSLNKCTQNDTVSCMTGSIGYEFKIKLSDVEQQIQNTVKENQNATITGSWNFNSIPKTSQSASNDNDLTNLKTVKDEISKKPSCQFAKLGDSNKIVTSILFASNGNQTGSNTVLCNEDPGYDFTPYKTGSDNKFNRSGSVINEIIYKTQKDSLVLFSTSGGTIPAHIYESCASCCSTQNHTMCRLGSLAYPASDKVDVISVYAKKGSIFYIYGKVDITKDDDGFAFVKQVNQIFKKNFQIIITEIPVNSEF